MGIDNLDKIFKPQAVAVIGASEKQATIGNALMRNLVFGGFEGELFPVNPKYSEICGLKSRRAISEIDSPIDLAIIATPIATVPDMIAECIQAGVGGAVIISAGGKEIGERGRSIENKIKREADKAGLRIIGPNCLGIICPSRQLNASFASDMPNSGGLAFISQSGAICTAILDLAFKEQIGFSHFVSIGSMLDVDFGDMIDYLGNDSRARSILLYVESLTNFRKFMSAARAVSRVKPIVVLKAGRSPAGARAAASHTGAMAGEDAVYDAAFERAGIVRVDTIDELFDCAELLAKQPRPRGHRLAIITNGGGPGVMATDILARHGIEPAKLAAQTIQDLDEFLPPFWSRSNPIDVLGDASAMRYAKTVEICLKQKEFDGILAILAPQALTRPEEVAEKLTEVQKGSAFPFFVSRMGGRDVAKSIEILNSAGIPTYETPERAIRAFLYMVKYARNLEMLQQIPPKLSRDLQFDRKRAEELINKGLRCGSGFLSETESKAILSAYGISVNPTAVAESESAAVTLAQKMEFPLAMKILSPDIPHKTEANGVQLDLRNEADIREAYQKIIEGAKAFRPDARIQGVVLQPFIERLDYELLIGSKRDDNFGPVILFGMGGIFTEVLKDRDIGLPPMNRLLVRRLMEKTRAYTLLHGYRNRPAAHMEQIEEMILRLCQLVVDFPEIAELDMNPVVVKKGSPFAVDARILLKPSRLRSPLHLVISPYPQQYEFYALTEDGVKVFFRPIRPEDAPLLVEFFNTLSPKSIYLRFFSYLKSLSHEMLARFTQIDYDREIALIALDANQQIEHMLAVAHVITEANGKRAEFSVAVSDSWQGKGIGAALLGRCLEIAQERGIETVWGSVLAENKNMLALGRKLGFKTRPEGEVYELTVNLKSVVLANTRK